MIPCHCISTLSAEFQRSWLESEKLFNLTTEWDGLGSQKGHIRLWGDCKGVITNNITHPTKFFWQKNFKVHPPDPTNATPGSKRSFTLELTATLMAHS
jgi:hypothetical protein